MERHSPESSRAQQHDDVLHATDTALRLVNQALGELGAADPSTARDMPSSDDASAAESRERRLAGMVARANADVAGLLDRVDQSRQILEEERHVRFQQVPAKLAAVTTATAEAATAMLDGLERALALVAALEHRPASEDDPTRRARYGALRNELYEVMSAIQFQDITSQQLGYAASVIDETEERLEALAGIFRSVPAGDAPSAPRTRRETTPSHVDPDALADKSAAQAFADALFDHR